MALLGFMVVQKEFKAYVLGDTVAGIEQRIRVAEPDNAENLKLSEEFKEKAAHIAELEKFYMAPLPAHEFLAGIAELRPEELIFNRVSFSERISNENKKMVTYQVTISGDVRSLTTLDNFKGILADAALFKVEGYTLEISEDLGGRDQETGIFSYTLNLALSPSAKGGKS
jgi:hypothetical protein